MLFIDKFMPLAGTLKVGSGPVIRAIFLIWLITHARSVQALIGVLLTCGGE